MIWQTISLISVLLVNFSSLSDNIKIFRRDYSKLDKEALIIDFSIDWVGQLGCYSKSKQYNVCLNDTFYSKISEIIDILTFNKTIFKERDET